VLCGVSLLLSLFVPDWIEVFTDASPDGGDGTAEWALSIGLLVGTVAFILLARRDWRALRADS
jgi:hypothetical protein